jgi:hypothetical protein
MPFILHKGKEEEEREKALRLSTVTLFSNGVMEVTDETGHHVSTLEDRFCNVWPAIYARVKKQEEQDLEDLHEPLYLTDGYSLSVLGGCLFFVADYYGGRSFCNPRALDSFYTTQFASVSVEPKP